MTTDLRDQDPDKLMQSFVAKGPAAYERWIALPETQPISAFARWLDGSGDVLARARATLDERKHWWFGSHPKSISDAVMTPEHLVQLMLEAGAARWNDDPGTKSVRFDGVKRLAWRGGWKRNGAVLESEEWVADVSTGKFAGGFLPRVSGETIGPATLPALFLDLLDWQPEARAALAADLAAGESYGLMLDAWKVLL